jgi:hypothetical protein
MTILNASKEIIKIKDVKNVHHCNDGVLKQFYTTLIRKEQSTPETDQNEYRPTQWRHLPLSLRDAAAKGWANYESLVARIVFYMVQPNTVSKIIIIAPRQPHIQKCVSVHMHRADSARHSTGRNM